MADTHIVKSKRARNRCSRHRKLRAIFAHLFPKAFVPEHATKKPLKIGIHIDIKQRLPEIRDDGLDEFLRAYIRSIGYQSQLVSGRDRYDLDGEKCGVVEEGHELGARNLLRIWESQKQQRLERALAARNDVLQTVGATVSVRQRAEGSCVCSV
jgi:sRNA-binding protein